MDADGSEIVQIGNIISRRIVDRVIVDTYTVKELGCWFGLHIAAPWCIVV